MNNISTGVKVCWKQDLPNNAQELRVTKRNESIGQMSRPGIASSRLTEKLQHRLWLLIRDTQGQLRTLHKNLGARQLRDFICEVRVTNARF